MILPGNEKSELSADKSPTCPRLPVTIKISHEKHHILIISPGKPGDALLNDLAPSEPVETGQRVSRQSRALQSTQLALPHLLANMLNSANKIIFGEQVFSVILPVLQFGSR